MNVRVLRYGSDLSWPACLLILATAHPGLAQQPDSVVGQRGTPTFGTVVDTSSTMVTVDTTAGKRQFPVNEIQKVTFGGEPRELRNARDAIARGQFESSRSDLEKIAPSSVSRDLIRQDIAFLKGLCDARMALAGGGDKSAAVRELLAFSKEAPTSYHYFQTVELLGDLAIALASFDNGIKYYGKLEEAPWPDYKLRATVLQAQAMVSSEKYSEALKKYAAVLDSTVDDSRARAQKRLATIGQAICLANMEKAEQGIKMVQQVIAENDSQSNPELFARAYNALGACYLKSGKPQDALLAYLHVDLMFNQLPDAHAEALFHLSSLWRTVKKSERALRARSLLESRYSGSVWADRK